MADGQAQFNSIAPLRNVAAMLELIERLKGRGPGIPGLGVFYGYSGYGKTSAATFAANQYQAVVVQVKSCWHGKKLVEAIAVEMGLRARGSVGDMVEEISEQLALSGRPLLIDEADFLVSKGLIEIVRDIYEGSQAPVVLIGEERMPARLTAWERVHNRVLSFVAAEPATINDVRLLATIYLKNAVLAEDLAEVMLRQSRHSLRRISVNLARIAEFAATRGLQKVGVADWKGDFFTGEAPAPRKGLV